METNANQRRLTQLNAGRKKPYTTTTERKSLAKLCWPREKPSRPVVDTKTSSKPRKPYLPPKTFTCGPYFFWQRQVPHWSRVVYGFFSQHPLTRNYYENTSLRIIFRNFWWIVYPQTLRERKMFPGNYAWNSQFSSDNYFKIRYRK